MSDPARRFEARPETLPGLGLPDRHPPPPHLRPQRAAPRARPPAARPLTSTPSHPRRRARRGFHPAFMVFSAIVVTLLIVGVVSISAMAVQTSFAVDAVERRITELADRALLLTNDVAALSAPGRVARWARDRGMVAPADVEVLTVHGGGTG